MTGEERKRLSPGLYIAAKAACRVLGAASCDPVNQGRCQCWDNAEATMRATGLSAQGVAWVFRNWRWIEDEASREAGT